jgi:hypothetical protein
MSQTTAATIAYLSDAMAEMRHDDPLRPAMEMLLSAINAQDNIYQEISCALGKLSSDAALSPTITLDQNVITSALSSALSLQMRRTLRSFGYIFWLTAIGVCAAIAASAAFCGYMAGDALGYQRGLEEAMPFRTMTSEELAIWVRLARYNSAIAALRSCDVRAVQGRSMCFVPLWLGP